MYKYCTKARIVDKNEHLCISIDPGVKHMGIAVCYGTRDGITNILHLDCVNFDDEIYNNYNPIYDNISEYLDNYSSYLPHCTMILIESQDVVQAYKMIKVAQHITSYFIFACREYNTPIIEISPKAKLKKLGAPSGMTYKQRDSWHVKKCKEICERFDPSVTAKLESLKKKSDAAVAILQFEAMLFCI